MDADKITGMMRLVAHNIFCDDAANATQTKIPDRIYRIKLARMGFHVLKICSIIKDVAETYEAISRSIEWAIVDVSVGRLACTDTDRDENNNDTGCGSMSDGVCHRDVSPLGGTTRNNVDLGD